MRHLTLFNLVRLLSVKLVSAIELHSFGVILTQITYYLHIPALLDIHGDLSDMVETNENQSAAGTEVFISNSSLLTT
jgi:hypothetical protein